MSIDARGGRIASEKFKCAMDLSHWISSHRSLHLVETLIQIKVSTPVR